MPLYTFEHAVPLTLAQQDELAEAMTVLHSDTFNTPRLFVNVDFVDASKKPYYVASRRRFTNIVKGSVRSSPARTKAQWDNMCVEITAAWDRVIAQGLPAMGQLDDNVQTKLHGVFLNGGMISIMESGIQAGPAGDDPASLKKVWPALEKRAADGDEEIKEMLEEVKLRGWL